MFERLIFALVNHFTFAGTTFFFGIGEGPSKGERIANQNTANLAAFDTGAGTSDISTSDNFWKAILSGDQKLISDALGPQFSAIAGRAQQEKNTTAQFSNRSGGTNASIQAVTDKTRAADTGLVDSLITHAADTLGSHGENLLSQASTNNQAAFGQQKTMHDQNAAMWSDIFNSIGQVVSGFTFGGGGGGSVSPSGGSSGDGAPA